MGLQLYFDSDRHAWLSGQLLGLLVNEKNDAQSTAGITEVIEQTDSAGNYKPMIEVVTKDGHRYRIIIAEIT